MRTDVEVTVTVKKLESVTYLLFWFALIFYLNFEKNMILMAVLSANFKVF